MARFSLSRIVRRRAAEPDGGDAPEELRFRRRSLPPPSQVRRERRALIRAREDRIRDLGGLVLEMYRRDGFREELIYQQCAELLGLEARLHELTALLSGAGLRRGSVAGRCVCGAPLFFGSHFCANCGRATADVPVVACASCGHALPADANFCAVCGHRVDQSARPGEHAPAKGNGANEGWPR